MKKKPFTSATFQKIEAGIYANAQIAFLIRS